MGGVLQGKFCSGLFCLNIPLKSLLVNYVNVLSIYKKESRQKSVTVLVLRENYYEH